MSRTNKKIIELPFFTAGSLKRRLIWLIRIRWFAILAFGLGIGLGQFFPSMHIDGFALSLVLVLLVLMNGLYLFLRDRIIRNDHQRLINLMITQIVGDLFILTILIYFTGSAESPLYFFYLFHMIVAAIIFPGTRPYHFAFLAVTLYTSLLVLEWCGILPHFPFYRGSEIAGRPEIVIFNWAIFIMTVFLSTYLAQDVTNRYRRVRMRLEMTNRRLQDLNRAKTNFLRVSSHELKAPIATIQSTLTVIRDILGENVDDRVRDMADRAIKRTDEMINLLKDLSDLTYGDLRHAGNFKQIDLNGLLTEVVGDELISAQARQIEMDLTPSKTPAKMVCDPEAIKKVFRNLVTNAIRYTPAGGSIHVKLENLATEILLEVCDTGIGLEPEEIQQIFNEFYRSPTAKKLTSAGTGLGLAIVQRLVDEHHGFITVSSQVNQGSTFQVHFPKESVL